jgi:hypothetical protein
MSLRITRRGIVLLVAVALVTRAREAYADSDGYYCVGSGFLAAEFRSFNTPGLIAAHVLKIARLDPRSGAHWTDQVVIDDFQVHVLTCGANSVLLDGLGGAAPGRISYALEVDSTGKATITKHSIDPGARVGGVGSGEPPNLGDWARPGITVFPQNGDGRSSFRLRATRHEERISPTRVRNDVRSIIELVVDEAVRDSLLVYEGHREESVDDKTRGL